MKVNNKSLNRVCFISTSLYIMYKGSLLLSKHSQRERVSWSLGFRHFHSSYLTCFSCLCVIPRLLVKSDRLVSPDSFMYHSFTKRKPTNKRVQTSGNTSLWSVIFAWVAVGPEQVYRIQWVIVIFSGMYRIYRNSRQRVWRSQSWLWCGVRPSRI
jgi:hypothetical protein